ncbi:MAG: TetR/AcrR family transcriptional regulator [Lachnospiraceae bacterium]|nr:TetR/AcrR family transcriptional regulator [Lachnospiraceae bacterium]
MEKKSNPIAEQSKQWIMEAMISLLKYKEFEKISISELVKKAGLSRRTFYRNFNSKTEVILSYCEKLCVEYLSYLDKDIDYSVKHIVEVYFTFWEQHLEFLYLLSNNDLLCHLIEVSNRYWDTIYERFQRHWKDNSSKIELEYCLLFNMGGLWNILMKWLYSDTRESPKELEKLVKHSLKLFIT